MKIRKHVTRINDKRTIWDIVISEIEDAPDAEIHCSCTKESDATWLENCLRRCVDISLI